MKIAKKDIGRSIKALSKVDNNLCISADNKGKMEMSCSSGNMNVLCYVDYLGTPNVSSCSVDMSIFNKVISATTTSRDVDLDIKDGHIRILGDLPVSVETQEAKQSSFPAYEWEKICNINTHDLSLVEPAMSRDITRSHLMKAYVSKGLSVSTDGHRLHVVGDYSEWDYNSSKGTCIPGVGVDILLSFGDSIISVFQGKRVATIRKDKNGKEVVDYQYAVKCVSDNMVLLAKLDDEDFLNFRQVMPEANELYFTTDTEQLLKILTAISKIHNPKDTVVLTCNKTDINLSCGMVKFNVKIVDTNIDEEIKCAFRCKYLIDAITKSKTIKIEMGPQLAPIKVTSGELQSVIMPIRI